MAVKIVIPVKKKLSTENSEIAHLKGTALQLAKLILEQGDYQFEGFSWLPGTMVGIAKHLGVSEKTIRRIVAKPPFHHITRTTEEDGKHSLVKLGTQQCETDLVFILRAVWVRGIVYYNGAAVKAWTSKVHQLQNQNVAEDLWKRLICKVQIAKEMEPELQKLKAGEHISLNVKPHEIGLLRGIAKSLTGDAPDVLRYLTTFDGWGRFMAYAKVSDRVQGRYYHWPCLSVIKDCPDLALQAYLDDGQASKKIDILDSTILLAKIENLTHSMDA